MELARPIEFTGRPDAIDGGPQPQRGQDRRIDGGTARAALDVMMTRNPAEARELVARKEAVRAVEQGRQRQHMGRLREGFAESIDTSSIHQEPLRALKQINAPFAMVAHPILAETGDLLESRLASRA